MEGAPYTPESATDKIDDKADKSTDKKRDKTTAAHSVAETLFNKSDEKTGEAASEGSKKEATFWERLSGEKASTAASEESQELAADDSLALHEATHEHINERQAEVQAELSQADPNSVEAVAAASDAALLEHAREQLGQPEAVTDIVPEAAFEAAYTQTVDDIEDAVEYAHLSPVVPELIPLNPVETPVETAPTPTVPPVPPTLVSQPVPGGYNSVPQPEATTAQSVTERDRLIAQNYAYRRGRNDGFFTGGLFGYLYGRRRGRKKAERRFKPVQERLEKQLKQVTEKLTHRERDIRSLAERKMEQAPQPVQYDKVVEKLAPQPTLPLTAETMPLPVVPAAEAAPSRQPTAAELAVSRSEYAGILPFNTSSDELSSNELKAIAQKVIIDHIPLKEMYEAGQFDEKGLRRIVNEFLRGGDVQKAVTKEVIRKDKAFELDPRLRQQAANDAATGGGATGTIEGQYRELPSEAGQAIGQSPKPPKKLPELGEFAKQDLMRKQVLSVAGVTLLVIIAIILALVATS